MTATTMGPGRDRRVVLLPAPSGESRVGGRVGRACWEMRVTATAVGPGGGRRGVLLPALAGATCVGRQTGKTHPVGSRRAPGPAGSGQ
ncbi:hypothetical protein ACIP2Y_38190 [Streptomyces sviceus]|uniref:hypothetical protein n=1 Tax=Streptomyces sviceus TaxID=285530 RepID=UPI00380496B7